MAHDVFISHSVKDKVTADAVCAMLESNGIRCWIAPRDVLPSMEWGEAIIDAIQECRIMVLVFTANANASPQIRREVERAVNRGVAILPLRVEDVLPGKSLEYFIGNVHWLDALTPPFEAHLKSLAGTIKLLLARMGPRDALMEPGGTALAETPSQRIGVPSFGPRETSPQDQLPRRDQLAEGHDPCTANAAPHFDQRVAGEEKPLSEAARSLHARPQKLAGQEPEPTIDAPQASSSSVDSPLGSDAKAAAASSEVGVPRRKKRKLAFVFVGIVVVFVPLIQFLATGSIPFPVSSTIPANEARAIESMRAIYRAEARYKALYPGKGYACSLAKLGGHGLFRRPNADAAQLLPNDLASGSKDGYIFQTACMWDSGGVYVGYNLYAFPKALGSTGIRGFCGDWQSDRISVDPEVNPARGPICSKPLD